MLTVYVFESSFTPRDTFTRGPFFWFLYTKRIARSCLLIFLPCDSIHSRSLITTSIHVHRVGLPLFFVPLTSISIHCSLPNVALSYLIACSFRYSSFLFRTFLISTPDSCLLRSLLLYTSISTLFFARHPISLGCVLLIDHASGPYIITGLTTHCMRHLPFHLPIKSSISEVSIFSANASMKS